MEALANVNQFGVCELREDELKEVDGGVGLTTVIVTVGKALIATGALATGIYTVKKFAEGVYDGFTGK